MRACKQRRGEYGKARQPGDADERVRPQKGPTAQQRPARSEGAPRVLVERAGRCGAARKDADVECDGDQHERAERIREPAGVARRCVHQRHDQHRRHRRPEHRDRLRNDLPQIEAARAQLVHAAIPTPRSARISRAARAPSRAAPSMKPCSSTEQCSPANSTLPWRTRSYPAMLAYWPRNHPE